MTRKRDSVLLLGLTLTVGCTGDPVGTRVPSPNVEYALIATPAAASADLVAKAIALALEDPNLRSGVRNAMRLSRVTEHKLVLQEFAATPTGGALLSAGAKRLGIASDSIMRTIATLSDLDFYVPNQDYRKNWRGDGSVLVGSAMGPDRSVFVAHSPEGASVRVANSAFAGAHAVFLLHPAERKALRINEQAIGAGTSIQDPNDGQIGGSILEYLPNGTTRETDLADLVSPGNGKSPRHAGFLVDCGTECGGGGGSSAPPDTTFLENLIVIDVCDNNNCGETNEFEWHTYISHNNGATFSDRLDLRLVGIPSAYQGHLHYIALFKKPQLYSNDLIQSDVVETDGISGDDHFGSPRWHNATFTSQSQNNSIMSEGPNLRCNGYVDGNGYPWYCDQGVFWRDVNQSMLWRNP